MILENEVLYKKDNQRLIVVLGMHRSGTSAITRGLRVLGATLGDQLMPPIEGINPKGFFEDIEINAFNIEAQAAIITDWFHLAPLEHADVEQLRGQGYFLRAVELLSKKIKDVDVFAFKDPRVAKLLPFWREVFEYLQLDVRYLLALRHPLSVVRSLAKRDGFAPEHSYLLWLAHVLESLRSSVGRPRIVVDYDRLMQSPEVEFARVAEAFSLELDAEEFESYKNDFLDAELRHTVYGPDDLTVDTACPPLVQEVFKRLSDVASDRIDIEGSGFGRELEQWLTEFERLKTSLILADNLKKQIASLSQAVAERDGQVASLSQAVTERDGQVASLSQAVTERDGQIASLSQAVTERDGQIDRILSSVSWRLTRPLRAAKRLARSAISRQKQLLRGLWRLLPLTVVQRARIKSALHQYVPVAGRWYASNNAVGRAVPSEATHQDATAYQQEYRQRFGLAFNQLSQDFVPLAGDTVDAGQTAVKVIAFYLPQFHPIPENDKNWGRGFTEWTNVSKAVPQFVGHYQPRLPGELGFYDLRLKDIQKRQIELARQYGIHGFCYHHYWFDGKRVLETPFQQVLNDPTLDLPFCLCWANENWTRRWDGSDEDVILAQNHSPEDDLRFFEDILPALKDPRYICIDGRPLLIVYRPKLLPDAAATARRWRQAAAEAGLPGLYVASAATFGFEDYKSLGYDGLVQFPPHNVSAPEITARQTLLNPEFSGHVYDYRAYGENAVRSLAGSQHTFPCVMMAWDNEPRKPGRGHIFAGCTPARYKNWLRRCVDFVLANNAESERIVFVNAWNEWAEGTYLEPDRRYGYAYLHATATVLRDYYDRTGIDQRILANNSRFQKRYDSVLVAHWYYFDLFDELKNHLGKSEPIDVVMTIPEHISLEQIDAITSSLENVYLICVKNHGRDILPFLTALPVIEAFGYRYLLKIHSKKSPQRSDGDRLRRTALGELLDNKKVERVLALFNSDATIGLVGPSGTLMSLTNPDYLVNNQKDLSHSLGRLGLSDVPLNFDFIAGSMFWARVDALRKLGELALTEDDFEEELGQLDGTLAHAIERLFVFLASQVGYRTLTLDQLPVRRAADVASV